ncbi:hypothetical protein VNO77_19935 [Canavalia gladiata]|uniref:Uncharacterized protein n=1 Tax=Canavalia gladiata TaxID=3824 RepID=A0AAN9LTI1_CANGL
MHGLAWDLLWRNRESQRLLSWLVAVSAERFSLVWAVSRMNEAHRNLDFSIHYFADELSACFHQPSDVTLTNSFQARLLSPVLPLVRESPSLETPQFWGIILPSHCCRARGESGNSNSSTLRRTAPSAGPLLACAIAGVSKHPWGVGRIRITGDSVTLAVGCCTTGILRRNGPLLSLGLVARHLLRNFPSLPGAEPPTPWPANFTNRALQFQLVIHWFPFLSAKQRRFQKRFHLFRHLLYNFQFYYKRDGLCGERKANLNGVNPANAEPLEIRLTTADGMIEDAERRASKDSRKLRDQSSKI